MPYKIDLTGVTHYNSRIIPMEKDKTLGQYIRELRLRKKKEDGKPWSQLDLSLAIGWENPSTLSRIENDDVKPTRDTLIKIANALAITDGEKNRLLVIAGYSLQSEHLTYEYIKQLKEKLKKDIDKYENPMIVLRDNGKLFCWNIYAEKFFFPDEIQLDKMIPELMTKTHMEIISDERYHIRQNILNYEEFSRIVLENFYAVNIIFEQENSMLNKEIKDKIENQENLNFQSYNIPFIYNHPIINKISFNISVLPLFLDQRFYIQQFIPTDISSIKKLKKYYTYLKLRSS